MYKTEIIAKNKLSFVDTKIVGSEDILFNFDYFYYCNKIFYTHQYFTHYRKNNPQSLTNSHGSTLFPRFLNLFNYLENKINNYALGSLYKTALNNRIAISMMNIGLSETSPKYDKSWVAQIVSINESINNQKYKSAYQNLETKYFPVHWKVFFVLCKYRLGTGVFLMLKLMRLFIIK